jgi:hypothetical protein
MRSAFFPYLGPYLGGVLMVALLAGCATNAPSPQNPRALASGQCLFQPLDETRVLDDHTLLALDRSGRAALIHMRSACLQPDQAVILRYIGNGPVCGPLDADIAGTMGGGAMTSHCMIDSLTPLSKAEAQKLLFNGKRP